MPTIILQLPIKVKLVLLKNLEQTKSIRVVTSLIDQILCQDEMYQKMHNEKSYKPYNFSGLATIESDGVYKAERIYSFTIRTIDFELAKYLSDNMKNAENEFAKCFAVENWILPKKHIEKLYSLTPFLLKSEAGYMRENEPAEVIEKRLFLNLIKKYKFFANEEVASEGFAIWNEFRLLNRKPIRIPYKNDITLLGDKVELIIDSGSRAQDIAYMVLGVGFGENCSRGCGYMNVHFI